MAKKRTKATTEPTPPAIRDRIKEMRRVPASELLDNEGNPRTHPQAQHDALGGVLKEVGIAAALIAYPSDRNAGALTLIDGHLRKNDYNLDWPTLILDVNDAEADLLLATHDPLAAMAGADKQRLDALLREVQTADSAVAKMLTELAEKNGIVPALPTPGAGGDEFDAGQALEGECRVTAGDLWLIDGGKHRLVCGDSTDAATVESLMGGEKAKAMVTDPPYAVDYVEKARDMNRRGYVHSRGTLAAAIEGDGINEGDARDLWEACFRTAFDAALDPHAALYIWHAQGRAMLTLYNLLATMGVLQHQTIIWKKNNFVIGRCDYQWIHEPCFYGWQKGNRPEFYGEKNQTTVWDIARDTVSPLHPTQKPVAMMMPPIENHLKSGEVVYDPFLGSGTTLIAAHRLNRRCFGVEIEPRYCEVILRRAEAEGLSVACETCA